MKKLICSLMIALCLGCAVHVGSFKFAIGNAHIITCPVEAPPDCKEEVVGGMISEEFVNLVSDTVGNAIKAVAAFFHLTL